MSGQRRRQAPDNPVQHVVEGARDLISEGVDWVREHLLHQGPGHQQQNQDPGGGADGTPTPQRAAQPDFSAYGWAFTLFERYGVSTADALARASDRGLPAIEAAYIAGPNRPVGNEGTLPAADLGVSDNNNNRAYHLDYTRTSAGIRPERPAALQPGQERQQPLEDVFQAHWDAGFAKTFPGLDLDRVRGALAVADLLGLQPAAKGLRADLFRISQYAAIDTLNVEGSGRYAATSSSTFCNVYAYDLVGALGAYIPRVWWYDAAIQRIRQGARVVSGDEYARMQAAREPLDGVIAPEYAKTVHELDADALLTWMQTYGGEFGWTKAASVAAAQEAANGGQVAVLLAKGRGIDGHITVITPEDGSHAADRDGQGTVTTPVQSQAGAINENAGTIPAQGQWWADRGHKDGSAWIFGGSMHSSLVPRELMGL